MFGSLRTVLTAALLLSFFAPLAVAEDEIPSTDVVRERSRRLRDTFSEIIGPEAMGMGRAYKAVGRGNGAIFFNPAALIQGPYYNLDFVAEFSVGGDQKAFSASVYDSDTNPYACTGVSFTYDNEPWIEDNEKLLEPGEDSKRYGDKHSIHRFISRAVTAVPVWGRNIGFGLGMQYLYIERPSRRKVNALTIDLGFFAKFDFGLSLAAVGYNLIPIGYDKTPMRFGWGTAYTAPFGLTVAYDMDLDFDSGPGKVMMSHMTGAEFAIAGAILRSGYTWDAVRDDHFWSVGAGYAGQGFSLQFAYTQGVQNDKDRQMSLLIRGSFHQNGRSGNPQQQNNAQRSWNRR